MAQTLEFSCKEEGCPRKVPFKPDIVVTYKMARGGKREPVLPVVYGEVEPTQLDCGNPAHGQMYNVVKFKCAEPGCKQIVVATTETKPVYEGNKIVKEGVKIKLTCDAGHECEYGLE